ncbi:transmembrane protein 272-like [Haliotis asinina]|uniref:transmembrane protein 272-like n=1 Tax=Haliotis asinina TaxID=109174 RepID=UPI0035320965
MSMLTRSGTLVRKNRGSGKRSSVRRTRSGGSSTSTRPEDDESSVPPSPITKFDPHCHARASPAKSVTSTVVSFNDDRQLYETNLEWDAALSSAQSSHDVCLQLQEANKEADGACDFACRGCSVICKSTLVTGILALSMVLPIVMLSMGVKYLNDCPLEPRIPVYLLVGGCFGMLKLTINLWRAIQSRKADSADTFYDVGDSAALTSRTYRVMNHLLNTFLLVWQVLGSYWVFMLWEPKYSPQLHRPSNWCDRTVYMFTVIQIIGLYTYLCLWILGACFLTFIYRSSCVGQIDNV